MAFCLFLAFFGKGSPFVAQAGLKLMIVLPKPLVLGLQVCTTTAGD
jgi:hypothetical protein